eukprot:gene25844-biopygen21027
MRGRNPRSHPSPGPTHYRTLERAWRGHGAGVARAIGPFGLGGAAWRGHGTGLACVPGVARESAKIFGGRVSSGAPSGTADNSGKPPLHCQPTAYVPSRCVVGCTKTPRRGGAGARALPHRWLRDRL